ncbi:MAG: hypothetical protein Q9227_004185 [Pyrenula ochraceoflavens]
MPAKLGLALLGFAVVTKLASALTCEVPGGTSDDGPAIKAALSQCNNGGTVILDKTYTIGTVLETTGLSNVAIELSGTVNLASNDLSYWTSNSFQLTYQKAYTAWLISGTGIHIYGGGTYYGGGDAWYAAGKTGPIPWTIYNSQNVLVENIHQTQSPFWHNFIDGSTDVTFTNMNLHSIQSDGSQAQNTDGWDVYRSTGVTISNSYIVNGDDCVSFKPNTTQTSVLNLYCQGSHGISVGSLGQYAGETDIVSDILVKNVTMVSAENGARIKAFGGNPSATSTSGGGSGYVRNVTFQDFTCRGCDLPIVIDQCYETSDSTCASYPSKVTINDVHYIDVTGAGTKSKEVVSLVCSDLCTDITATGTHLVGSSGSSEYFCTNIFQNNQVDDQYEDYDDQD